MLTLYPSNKLEHLSVLLSTLLARQPAEGFTPDIILVESPGMQHWLNMQLAREQGIAMNILYPLPVRFMWDIARTVLGEARIPRESPYRREVLRWRIYKLLDSAEHIERPDMARVATYLATDHALGKLQLAVNFADLLEQYLLYRPDWLLSWERHQSVTDDPDEPWQAYLWRALVTDIPLYPARLYEQLIEGLKASPDKLEGRLPSRIILFAINTMAPQFVGFLDALSAVIDVHVFHLNPCVNYWGNVASRGEQARILRQQGIEAWMAQNQDNPLLANLGKQGRDLFNQLTQLDSYEISAFDAPAPEEENQAPLMLHLIQQDILEARNANGLSCWQANDRSIVVSSAHSALREVQHLHEHLLGLLNDNPRLQPKDVLVMCPAIEQYAPFIDAVFARVGQQRFEDDASPRIPCSVADRSPLDAEPLIAAFLSLLQLPDSRFSVNQIIEYLSLSPLQKKFGLTEQSLLVIEHWLRAANIHWGLDGEHKARSSQQVTDSPMFSWSWGFKRLMLGMVAEDREQLLADCVTVPDVEGQQSVELGRLMLVLEQLANHTQRMHQARTPLEWTDYLLQLRDDCFTPAQEDNDTWESIGKAIADLTLQSEQADFNGALSLVEVRDILNKRFGTPDAGNHFMTGQVTFCSMLPMRSIPFKVIAILGLNDGEFPRSNPPGSINIMARSPARLGDRSRRQEDRYLFLEALISARQHLYLSYQGRSAQDNSERQPSLVLQELMDYLSQGYDWHTKQALQQVALHPFSPGAFTAAQPGFSAGWFRLAQAMVNPPDKQEQGTTLKLTTAVQKRSLTTHELTQCFRDPLAWLARLLGVSLVQQDNVLSDAEPFETDKLTRYQFVEGMVEHYRTNSQAASLTPRYQLSGRVPQTPTTELELLQWEQAAQVLADTVSQHNISRGYYQFDNGQLQLSAYCEYSDSALVMYHVGQHATHRSFQAWLTLLLANSEGVNLPLTLYYVDWKKDNYPTRSITLPAMSADMANEVLESLSLAFSQIEQSPTIVHLALGELLAKHANMRTDSTEWQQGPEVEKRWSSLTDPNNEFSVLGHNPYLAWFYPILPEASSLPLSLLARIYEPFFQAMAGAKS
ncbi:exodeoxyribonuclease V subunit gamma [Aestuariibacter sp. GS-14]|uniref:exodeoxyribonuclease V subunit gamma n=1 Tax=Aestuariibacter sp. GS-14 TaxID=2590670 RepID=UPI0015E8590F|nr:exodeoxyribonuclease V subunit gamma [Aestuariibacter sp. GS-14]